MTNLQTITTALRTAVDDGDLGAISEGVAALEEGCTSNGPPITVFRYSEQQVAFNIKYHEATVCLRLSIAEVERMIEELKNYSHVSQAELFETEGWWDWGSCHSGEDPPICLYRDDGFCIDLPHDVGLKLLAELERVRESGLPKWRDTDAEMLADSDPTVGASQN